MRTGISLMVVIKEINPDARRKLPPKVKICMILEAYDVKASISKPYSNALYVAEDRQTCFFPYLVWNVSSMLSLFIIMVLWND